MAIESQSDLDSILSDWDSVTLSPGRTYPNRNDKTVVVNGIFDNAYVQVDNVESLVPIITAKTSDCVGMRQMSMAEVSNSLYKVTSVQQDGSGLTTLYLERQ